MLQKYVTICFTKKNILMKMRMDNHVKRNAKSTSITSFEKTPLMGISTKNIMEGSPHVPSMCYCWPCFCKLI